MRKFLKYTLSLSLPFVFMLLYYIVADPFMIVWKYKEYSKTQGKEVCPNAAVLGIQLLDLYSDSIHYNSFIVGNSRSIFYEVDDWQKYIGQDAIGFHFYQSGDNLRGTLERVRYLYNRFEEIDNFLFVMDHEYLSDMSQKKGYLLRNPWQVTDERDFIDFHLELMSDYFSFDYILSHSDNQRKLSEHTNLLFNELHKDEAEVLLNEGRSSEYFSYFAYMPLFSRDSTEKITEPVIGKEQVEALNTLASLVQSHNTDYRIVISPLYDQEKLNPKDLAILKRIFGEDNVFDFSGINEYTNDTTNYYEDSHYRPKLCNKIMQEIYK